MYDDLDRLGAMLEKAEGQDGRRADELPRVHWAWALCVVFGVLAFAALVFVGLG